MTSEKSLYSPGEQLVRLSSQPGEFMGGLRPQTAVVHSYSCDIEKFIFFKLNLQQLLSISIKCVCLVVHGVLSVDWPHRFRSHV